MNQGSLVQHIVSVRAGRAITIALLFLLGCQAAPFQAPAGVPGLPESARVRESRTQLHDRSRERAIPIKIYEPETGDGPWPLVIFSHGLGSSREGYRYLGRHWAAHGYLVIHLQHAESDNRLTRLALYRAALAGDVEGHRPRDVSSVIDALEGKPNAGPQDAVLARLQSRVDLRRIGVAGHSFGAYTVLAVAGLLIDFPDSADRSFHDPRVRAAVAISSPKIFGAPRREDYRAIAIPILHLTGTEDRTRFLRTSVRDRRIPFDAISGDQYLVTVRGARHGSFAQEPGATEASRDKKLAQALASEVTLRFWNAFLLGVPTDRSWLDKTRLPFATIERR
ncbi:MAG TPA: hypothetical protein VNM92_14750 [Thermoanaerobaculia bacterium]|nr:hypothetical protein [Thermoanaerobaculia bacterium]